MSLTYEINDIVIPDADIVKYGRQVQQIDRGGKQQIAAKRDIVLDDIDRTKYNPLETGSLFFGIAWYNKLLTIYNEDEEEFIWVSRIKDIKFSYAMGELVVVTSNFLQDMIDTKTVKESSDNTTIAALIYDLLTNLMGIPTTNIRYSTFQDAINIQTAIILTGFLN